MGITFSPAGSVGAGTAVWLIVGFVRLANFVSYLSYISVSLWTVASFNLTSSHIAASVRHSNGYRRDRLYPDLESVLECSAALTACGGYRAAALIFAAFSLQADSINPPPTFCTHSAYATGYAPKCLRLRRNTHFPQKIRTEQLPSVRFIIISLFILGFGLRCRLCFSLGRVAVILRHRVGVLVVFPEVLGDGCPLGGEIVTL